MDIAGLIEEGDTVAWSTAAAEPVELLRLLQAGLERVPRATALIGLSLSDTIDPARLAARMAVKALGGAGTNRRFAEIGALDVLPAHYSLLPDMVAQGTLPVDVALVQLAADGPSLGFALMIDYAQDAARVARVVVAEVNDQAPFTHGDTGLDGVDAYHAIRVSHPLPQVRSAPAGPAQKAIGEHVARLVPDGATLQVGLGSLPDAVLECLAGKRHLGVHCGTMGDRVLDLIEAGVVTNAKKPIDTGLTVTAGLLGTDRLYRWAHRNERLRTRSSRYTHDNLVHRQLPSLIGINSALEVDLTGQINAEVAEGRHMGLVGGHGDFMRGCVRSPGGRGIVALESTARGGRVSRIVAKLSAGTVTTARADADVVVTEHGIAELRGRTLAERARALIAIAHPSFRRDLAAAADAGLV